MKNSVQQVSRSLRYFLAAAAIVSSAAGCAAHDASGADGPFGDPSVVANLHALGLQISSNDGVPSPTKMYAVAVSDRQAAETALGGGIINDHTPVFVIVMTGGPYSSREAPPGASPPEGSVLTVTLNAATYAVTDGSISNMEPDLSKVASVTVDLLAK